MLSKIAVIGSLIFLVLLSIWLISLINPPLSKAQIANEMQDILLEAETSCSTDADCVLVNVCEYTCELDCKYINRDSSALGSIKWLKQEYKRSSGDSCSCSCTCNTDDVPICIDGQCVSEFWPLSLSKTGSCNSQST